ncbi:MAG TPA: hypothetical protein VFL42_01575 [Terriglobales bacterium]|nr:hypothetical protein [Terriglobales bacterium]
MLLRRTSLLAAAMTLAVLLAGCVVSTHKDRNAEGSENKDVDIRTPLGSLSVRQTADAKETGLALYPGATPKKDSEHEGGANVNISSSLFGVKVVAVKFQSDDAPDKVMGFYRKEMGRYGKVVECTGGFNLNFHPRDKRDKDAEVTCNSNERSDSGYKQELKVGTENNQRIVAVKPSGKGSEFALVYVRAHDDKDTM